MGLATQSYNDLMEHAYPASKNASDPVNRQMRELFFQFKDFGYDDFTKNNVVISKFKEQNKLEKMDEIAQALEASYNRNSRPVASASANSRSNP